MDRKSIAEGLRGSGRTHRILTQALDAAEKAPLVFVLGWDEGHVVQLMEHLMQILNQTKHLPTSVNKATRTVELKEGSKVRFVSSKSGNWDWDVQRMRGYDPKIPVFIDHWTAEKYHVQQALARARAIANEERGER